MNMGSSRSFSDEMPNNEKKRGSSTSAAAYQSFPQLTRPTKRVRKEKLLPCKDVDGNDMGMGYFSSMSSKK